MQEIWRVWSIILLSLLPGSLGPGVWVPVRLPSVGQIELFRNYLQSLGLCAKKLLTNNYTKNVNRNSQWMGFFNLLAKNNPRWVCYVLTFWPSQKCHSRLSGRKWHILMAVMRGNRVGGNWLIKFDKVKKKSHYTLIDWCTGREWPLNCMTVIFARWQSHRPFQR